MNKSAVAQNFIISLKNANHALSLPTSPHQPPQKYEITALLLYTDNKCKTSKEKLSGYCFSQEFGKEMIRCSNPTFSNGTRMKISAE